MEFIILNRNLSLLSDLKLLASNRAFLYGDGVFETIKVVSGKVFNFAAHFERLKKSLEFLDIDCNISSTELLSLIEKLLSKNNINNSGRVRISFYRDSNGKYLPDNNKGSFIIQSFINDVNYFELNKSGLSLGFYNEQKKNSGSLSNLKSVNAVIYVLASLFAKKKSFDDAIIFNEKDIPIETSNSNIFILKDNVVITPDLSQGCVEGTMRNLIIDILKNNYKVLEKKVNVKDFALAKEVFISNSISGIKWVKQVEEFKYESYKVSSSIINSLNKLV
jgi:branched-chain amino acid aminotransferase